MNHPTNPAWEGAVTVARARLHTIDDALAKLEAAVPGIDVQPPAYPPQPPVTNTPPPPNNQMAAEIQHAKDSDSFPETSLRALEAFTSGAI